MLKRLRGRLRRKRRSASAERVLLDEKETSLKRFLITISSKVKQDTCVFGRLIDVNDGFKLTSSVVWKRKRGNKDR